MLRILFSVLSCFFFLRLHSHTVITFHFISFSNSQFFLSFSLLVLIFIQPPLCSRFRNNKVSASFMTMPEATMNKYHRMIFLQNNIGPPRKFFGIETITQSLGKKIFPDQNFRLCIFTFVLLILKLLVSLECTSIISNSYSTYGQHFPFISSGFIFFNFVLRIMDSKNTIC